MQPEPIAPAHEPSFAERPAQVSQPAPEPDAHEDEKPVLRRSTVREKVSFGSSAPAADTPAPVVHSAPEPSPAASSEPAPADDTSDNQPRKAGWWSRRFGGGD